MTRPHIPRARSYRKPIGARARFNILERDGFRCRYCGADASKSRLHLDHIVPHSANGPDHRCNLVTACRDCNFGKGSKPIVPVSGSGIENIAISLMGYHGGEALSDRQVSIVRDFFLSEPDSGRLLDQICGGASVQQMIAGMYRASGFPE